MVFIERTLYKTENYRKRIYPKIVITTGFLMAAIGKPTSLQFKNEVFTESIPDLHPVGP